MVVHFCRQKDSSTFVEVTAIAMISSSFLIGDTFPTAQGHFIPFHTPRELPITMKEILSIKDDRGPWSTHSQCRYRGEEERPWISKGNFLETLSRCCWLLGEIVDLLDSSWFSFGLHVYPSLGTRGGNNKLLKELWLSSSSTGPDRATVGRKQLVQTSTKISELGGHFMCLFVSFILSSLDSISSPSTGSLCHFLFLQLSLGHYGLLPLPLCCLALSLLHRHPGWTAGSVLVPSFWNGCTPPRQMAV